MQQIPKMTHEHNVRALEIFVSSPPTPCLMKSLWVLIEVLITQIFLSHTWLLTLVENATFSLTVLKILKRT